jgi:hypothetical protein
MAADAPPLATPTADDSVAPLIGGATDVVQAWARLLDLELALAHRSMRWLAVGALALPIVGLGVWFASSALGVVLVHAATGNWVQALALAALGQALALALLLRALRGWLRDLTLPQSRAALRQVMERLQ